MGGHATYDEIVAHLDTMAMLYPNLITNKITIGQSIEGRELWMVKISDNPNVNEEESEVLYTALHHAREPAGAMTLLFYMYYLLENYEDDSLVQFLVDNSEMHFVLVVNPDGYVYNETEDPNGGGMWRKNRRDNGVPDCEGVDPNRNYGYMWGYNDDGSSHDPCEWNYRGDSAFSEPEIGAIRDLCENHEFQFTLNYHTWGNELFFPWGYIPETTPDNEMYYAFASQMTADSHYAYGIGSTFYYETNGDADDWMYGEQTTKGKIFSFTPELGGEYDGFWCAIDRIIPIAQENMIQNILVVSFSGTYASFEETASTLISESSGYITFDITRLGLQDGGTYTVSLEPISDEIISTGDDKVFNGLELMETVTDSISYSLQSGILNGTSCEFTLSLNFEGYEFTDTITKIYGDATKIFEDSCDTMTNWITAFWDVTTSSYYSPPGSITDSPDGEYSNNNIDAVIMNQYVDIPEAAYAGLRFMSKWEIEEDYDYVKLQIKMDGISWTALEGMHTEMGTNNQSMGKPIYEGLQTNWVQEEVDLMDYIGNSVTFRFLIQTNDTITEDGFYFDDFKIIIVEQSVDVDEIHSIDNNLSLVIVHPNPFNTSTTLSYDLKAPSTVQLSVYNQLGQLVYLHSEDQSQGSQQLNWKAQDMPEGLYYYRLQAGEQTANGKMVKVR